MKKTYAILAAIAAFVLAVYALMPNLFFEENVFPAGEDVTVFGFDDVADGGSSEVKTIVSDTSLSFECTLGSDSGRVSWCGLLWNMDSDSTGKYRNWLFVDSIVIDMEAHGAKEVLVKVWTFDPDVTNIREPRSFRLLMKEVPLIDGRQRLCIPMEDMYTPNFWYKGANVDSSLRSRHQESVARFEIFPEWNQPKGKKFSFKFYSIKAVGVSNIPFGIVLGIFLILTIVAVGRRHQNKNDNENS